MPNVTVVPADKIIIVDDVPLWFDFPYPENLHAIQWNGDTQTGHMEWINDYNMELNADLYAEEVAPFVALYNEEMARLASIEEEPESLDAMRPRILNAINKQADFVVSAMLSTYPERELITFDRQEQEARAWLVNNNTSTPFLSALALARGLEMAELVRRVIAKADAFAVAAGTVAGRRQALEDELDLAETREELLAVEAKIKTIGEGLA